MYLSCVAKVTLERILIMNSIADSIMCLFYYMHFVHDFSSVENLLYIHMLTSFVHLLHIITAFIVSCLAFHLLPHV